MRLIRTIDNAGDPENPHACRIQHPRRARGPRLASRRPRAFVMRCQGPGGTSLAGHCSQAMLQRAPGASAPSPRAPSAPGARGCAARQAGLVDQGDDPHRPVALRALQGIGFQSSFMQMGDNTFASLSSPRPQHGAGGEGPASSHVLTTLGRPCGSASPRRPWRAWRTRSRVRWVLRTLSAHPDPSEPWPAPRVRDWSTSRHSAPGARSDPGCAGAVAPATGRWAGHFVLPLDGLVYRLDQFNQIIRRRNCDARIRGI